MTVATKKIKPTCLRCGKEIAKGPGRCARCLGLPLRPTSPGWQRRPTYRDPDEE
jgi:primosomal protein N'